MRPTLEYFAAAGGDGPIAVVAMPHLERATTLGGMLGPTGSASQCDQPWWRGARTCPRAMPTCRAHLHRHGYLANPRSARPCSACDASPLPPRRRSRLPPVRARSTARSKIAEEHTGVIATPRPHTDAAVATIVESVASRPPRRLARPAETRAAYGEAGQRVARQAR